MGTQQIAPMVHNVGVLTTLENIPIGGFMIMERLDTSLADWLNKQDRSIDEAKTAILTSRIS
jgi:hypothetical protein